MKNFEFFAQTPIECPSAFLKPFIACSLLLLIFCVPAIAGDKVDKEAVINCIDGTFDSLELDNQKNEVYPGNKLTWYVRGKKYTSVKIEFVKKNEFCKGESPFPSPSFTESIKKDYGFKKIDSDKAKDVADDTCYTYKVTCTPPSGTPIVIDPIIDVPKP